jgi:hypothetical protein
VFTAWYGLIPYIKQITLHLLKVKGPVKRTGGESFFGRKKKREIKVRQNKFSLS